MICIGYSETQKLDAVSAYRAKHGIENVFVLTAERFAVDISDAEQITWQQIIQYKYFYRLLQEINGNTLVVVNECLRTKTRSDLTYNCIRHFLNQTKHQVIFQRLPIIDSLEDFMILFDFDTRSRWKREKFNDQLLDESEIRVNELPVRLSKVEVPTPASLHAKYEKEKEKLFAGLGLKDPHTIPRNLHLLSGKEKVKHLQDDTRYVARNNRLSHPSIVTYKDVSEPGRYTVFEFCHNAIDFTDFLCASDISGEVDVLTTELRVDQWYFDRFTSWAGVLDDAYAAI